MKPKQPTPFNIHSTEFKTFENNFKQNANVGEKNIQKNPQINAVVEKTLDNKKKLSLKSTSKPFTLNSQPFLNPEVKNNNNAATHNSITPQNNVHNPNNNILDALNPNKQEHQHIIGNIPPLMNFSDGGSSSFPKLTNKNKMKTSTPFMNSPLETGNEKKNNDIEDKPKEILKGNTDLEQPNQKKTNEEKSPIKKEIKSLLKPPLPKSPEKTDKNINTQEPLPKVAETHTPAVLIPEEKKALNTENIKEKENVVIEDKPPNKQEPIPKPCYKDFMISLIHVKIEFQVKYFKTFLIDWKTNKIK